ncbi:MAG: ABC transporter ATP-binding protein [Acidobacteriota bacterium]
MAPAIPALEVTQVTKVYAGRVVLDRLDLTVHRGEALVILGPSGCGKSTLMRCLIGLEDPDGGSVRLDGVDLSLADARQKRSIRRRMGVAFQGGALFGSMTVAENIELPLAELTDLPPPTRRIIARIKLGMVGLEDAMDRRPAELSGGMIKRAALARALALDPEFVFFDEPSAGLDPITAAGLDRLLIGLRKTAEMTLVVVTHELASAFAIADRLALMHEGRFRIIGTPEQVRSCDDEVVQRFLTRRPTERTDSIERFRRFIDELDV